MSEKKILLHSCCGPCSAYPVSLFLKSELICFFSNSNIYPEAEYKKRFLAFKKNCLIEGVDFVEDTYDHNAWLDFIKGFEDEAEKGKRCRLCFDFRLRRSFEFAKSKNIKYIASTLTVAPYKDSKMVFDVARELSKEYGIAFEEYNFKKNDGYLKTRKLSKDRELYMQGYCGCEFSLNDLRRKNEQN
jgi:epoxyqueuosine reductase